jgi:hypothetical protein
MSKDDRQNAGQNAGKSAGENADKNKDGYAAGYGKPPSTGQFKKGKSGNPGGRPRKSQNTTARRTRLSDMRTPSYLEEEAYREITLRENGVPITLSALQAVLRSLATEGIKGKRLSQKLFFELVTAAEEAQHKQKIDYYIHLEGLKRNGERLISECENQGKPAPDLLPHPDDIVLNPRTGDATIKGPRSPEDLEDYRHSQAFRDFLILCSVHAEKAGGGPTYSYGEKKICSFLLFAALVDTNLPRRFRWEPGDDLILMMEYRDLTRRACERRIAAERIRLMETAPAPLYPDDPKMQKMIRKVADLFA